jgi:CRISPR-associated protein Csm4
MYMKELVFRIKPKSVFPTLHSDTLFGALCVAFRDLYGESYLVSLLERFDATPPFLVSSAFPYVVSDQGPLYFFPKPIEVLERKEDFSEFIDRAKALKKVRFISEARFAKWIDGEGNNYLLDHFDEFDRQMGLLYEKQRLRFSIESVVAPQNQINRLSSASENIFYSEGTRYRNAGLFFLVRVFDKELEDPIRAGMRFLSDRGFGGDVAVGKGHFELEDVTEHSRFPEPVNASRFVTLSRYHPSKDESLALARNKESFYDIETKRGRTAGGSVKRLVRFFSTGSTFPRLNDDACGTLVRVHDTAVEYGFAFPVAMR